jgi:hypothetical protein
MAGIRPPDNAAPAAQPESTEEKYRTLFVLCSQYVLFQPVREIRRDAIFGFVQQPVGGVPLARSSVSGQTNARFRCCASTTMRLRIYPMIGKRVQFHDETWQELRLLAAESMKSFQELADEAFNDLLKKHGRPASLKEALRKSAGQTAKVIPLKRRGRVPKDSRKT